MFDRGMIEKPFVENGAFVCTHLVARFYTTRYPVIYVSLLELAAASRAPYPPRTRGSTNGAARPEGDVEGGEGGRLNEYHLKIVNIW